MNLSSVRRYKPGMTLDPKQIPELDLALTAAHAAGDILMRYSREGVSIREKAASDLVSDADVDAERAIVDMIKGRFPDHSILAEEGYATQGEAEHLWIVDPLDGTTNFAHGIPHFAVSIAYYHQGVPQVGVVWNPAREDCFMAARGHGAWHNGVRKTVSPAKQMSEVLVGVGFYYDRGRSMEATLAAIGDIFRQQIRGIRRWGTAALDLCHVGSGLYGAFFEYQLAPWDFGAGRLFVEEAGGRVTTARGDALPFEKTSVLATNGHLHETMLSIVGSHHPADE
ncbi:MAG: inositol monophosphatase [Planctomycetaceae bacterium]|nr:inositol monophosphatase [Planctomycetaceae bacterium]